MKSTLKSIKTDIYHGHGLWQLPVHYMAKRAYLENKPYVITPRGMLEPWPMTQNKFKKQIALYLYQLKDLRNSSCIHVTSVSEAENIRKMGIRNPIALIPNGINLCEFTKVPRVKKERKKVLFLSRIHKKKGIEMLIESWQSLESTYKNNWCVEVIGNGDKDYIKFLNTLIYQKGCQDSITIKPPVFGIDKINAYSQADLLYYQVIAKISVL